MPCQKFLDFFFFFKLKPEECWVGRWEADGWWLGSGNLLRECRSSKPSVRAGRTAFFICKCTHTPENPHKHSSSLHSRPVHLSVFMMHEQILENWESAYQKHHQACFSLNIYKSQSILTTSSRPCLECRERLDWERSNNKWRSNAFRGNICRFFKEEISAQNQKLKTS